MRSNHFSFFYRNGQEIQKISTIDSLDSILKEESPGCLKDILPLVRDSLNIKSRELQIAGATVLCRLLRKQFLESKKFVEIFLDHVLIEFMSGDIGM